MRILERLWHARSATLLVLGIYVLWAIHGFATGWMEHREPDRLVRSQVQLYSKHGSRAVFRGDVGFGSIWIDHDRAAFFGGGTLSLDRRSHAPGIASFTLEIVSARAADRIEIVDTRSGRRQILRNLRPWLLDVEIPVLGGASTLEFEPTAPDVQYRISDFSLVPARYDSKFRARERWHPPLTVGGFTLELGSGWFKRAKAAGQSEADADRQPIGQNEMFSMRRTGFVRLTPPKPHAYWLAFPFLCHLPGAPTPTLIVDGAAVETPTVTAYGENQKIRRLAFGATLGATSIVEVSCDDGIALRSPVQLGTGRDPRAFSFGFGFFHLDSVATAPRAR